MVPDYTRVISWLVFGTLLYRDKKKRAPLRFLLDKKNSFFFFCFVRSSYKLHVWFRCHLNIVLTAICAKLQLPARPASPGRLDSALKRDF